MNVQTPSPDDELRPARCCPSCRGTKLRRTRRRAEDRKPGVDVELRRYRCRKPDCDWAGLLPRRAWLRSGSRAARSVGARRGALVLAVSALAATAALALVPALWRSSEPDHRALRLARGESYTGMPLTASHGLLKVVSPRDGGAAAEAGQANEPTASAPGIAKPRAPLHLRQFCAWGEPGRDPYRGTPEQAMALAQLPPEVVKRINADIQAGRHTDQLTITNAAIRADRSGREFDPKQIAMSFGQTLCLDTRVNFKTDHAERAELYEATADNGRVYAVMVPRVCGNVSVLGQRGERVRRSLDGVQIVDGDDDAALRLLPDALITAEDDGRARRSRGGGLEVPEPGTLLMAGAGLAALALASVLLRRG